MYALNNADDYDNFTNYTDNENEDINTFINYLLLSIPANVLFFFFIGSII